jgi:YbbR domain-containing protein
MDFSKIEEYKEKLLSGWESLLQKSNEDEIAEFGRERVIVFIVALILAMALWMMVNLSRSYTLNIELPIQLGAVPTEMALAQDLPTSATVNVTGEGWKLINLYNNPPTLNIDVDDTEVNLFDQVQQQMNAMPNVSIQNVQPQVLTVQLDNRISKKVPVRSKVNALFADQYDFISPPQVEPDSITINGASAIVESIKEWQTDSVAIKNVRTDISQTIPLEQSGNLISLSQNEVEFVGEVAQYTEAEVEVNVSTQNLPSGRMVSYSPLAVRIKYDVPIDEYTEMKDENPFDVYVSYQQILEDSTGFVTPQIEQREEKYYVKLRSFQPRRVAYYIVLEN